MHTPYMTMDMATALTAWLTSLPKGALILIIQILVMSIALGVMW
jgi:hypothetical protein